METKWERELRQKDARAKQIVARWVGITLIVAGMVFLSSLLYKEIRLLVLGTKAVGQVVAYDSVSKRTSKVRVRVTRPNGETIEFLGTSLKGVHLEVGEMVPVYYILNEPPFGAIATFRLFWLGAMVFSGLMIVSFGGGWWILRVWSGWF
jgi:hypothetical protein